MEAAVRDDLALLAGSTPSAIGWQLAAVLPDLVDAVSPGGQLIDEKLLAREIAEASAFDDRSAEPSAPGCNDSRLSC